MRHTLRDLRLARGLTQNDVAVATGTTKEYYSLIETGRRAGTMPYWRRLQTFFELMDGELWAIVKEGAAVVENDNATC